jgi:hypothetical protein
VSRSTCLLDSFLGAPGSGKTLLGTHFLAAGARQGQRGLHFGFYETPIRLLDKARQVGLDLSTFSADGSLVLSYRCLFGILVRNAILNDEMRALAYYTENARDFPAQHAAQCFRESLAWLYANAT